MHIIQSGALIDALFADSNTGEGRATFRELELRISRNCKRFGALAKLFALVDPLLLERHRIVCHILWFLAIPSELCRMQLRDRNALGYSR